MQKQGITFVWGISGCGKKTVGRLLANTMGVSFVDGDALLESADPRLMFSRELQDLRVTSSLLTRILQEMGTDVQGAVVGLSCLTKKSRDLLRGSLAIPARFLFLECTIELALARLKARGGRLTAETELQTQSDLCANASDSLMVDGSGLPTEVLSRARILLGLGANFPMSR